MEQAVVVDSGANNYKLCSEYRSYGKQIPMFVQKHILPAGRAVFKNCMYGDEDSGLTEDVNLLECASSVDNSIMAWVRFNLDF